MPLRWFHNYSAVGNSLGLTALVMCIPVVFLFWALSVKRMKGHVAGLLTLLLITIITTLGYGMPVPVALSAAVLGMVNGLFQIGWIILAAVYLYNLTVESGQLEIIKSSIASLSTDRRLQALLIAFCFSAFMEGTAGMGAPVAVCAAMLIGIGFAPLQAALVCLVGNTQPVPFGPLGVPTIMMASVTRIDDHVLARAVGMDMVVLALIIPIFMLVVMAGWKSAIDVLPAALVAGGSYAITCLLVTRYLGPELPALLSSVVSIVSLVVFLKLWKPRQIWRFPNDPDAAGEASKKHSVWQVIYAWTPFLVLMIVMCIWSVPEFKLWMLNASHLVVNIPAWPFLDGIVYRNVPIVAKPTLYAASYRWEVSTAPGTAIFFASLISIVLLRVSPARAVRVFVKSLNQMKIALITLASVVGIAYVANYSGMSYTLALALAFYTGKLFPVVSPVIGWMGVFLTGSVTSSAVLFGKLQQVTALQIGINPVLTTSANLAGGVTGKLISPQSLAISCAATGMAGRETDIFRKTWRYSLILLGIIIALVVVEAYILPGIVPRDVLAPVAAGTG
ncbi:L-lactate permease [Acidicapsa acidisoli]|uniref:L-lactate permease n=1 Tax=Acidicapsa acidisoli TaxID=1615681 RepID=UPI0021E0167C|nr:lactate permease LctP family transporter [Acidicapsa acidisoli]